MTRKGNFLQSEEHLASHQDSKMSADDYGGGATENKSHHHAVTGPPHHIMYPSKQQTDTLPLPPPDLGDLGCGSGPPMPEAIYAAPGEPLITGTVERDTMGKIPRKYSRFALIALT